MNKCSIKNTDTLAYNATITMPAINFHVKNLTFKNIDIKVIYTR